MDNCNTKEKSNKYNEEYYYDIVRYNIKRFRLLKKLTQQDLAEKTELSREYICDIENKKRNKHPTIGVLGRIAEAMDVHIVNFFVSPKK